jgi:uridine phosphorylase
MNPIPASELILTDSGAIYHLGVRPDQLAPTVITVGDPGRVAEVSKYFDRIEHRVAHREFVTHTGYLGEQRFSVVSSGIGPDNMDIVMNELDALVNIDFGTRQVREQKTSLQIIRLGTTGSLQADIPVDAPVASDFGLGLDNVLHFYSHHPSPTEHFLLQAFEQHSGLAATAIRPYIAEGSIRLRALIAGKMAHGITLTCPGFFGPQGRILRAPLAIPGLNDRFTSFQSADLRITNYEMETSVLYALGRLLGHQCLSVCTVVANRVSQTFSSNPGRAVDATIRMTLELLSGSGL